MMPEAVVFNAERYASFHDGWIIPPFVDSFLKSVYITNDASVLVEQKRVSLEQIFQHYREFILTCDATEPVLALAEASKESLLKYLRGAQDILNGNNQDAAEKIQLPASWMKQNLNYCREEQTWNLGFFSLSTSRRSSSKFGNGSRHAPEHFFAAVSQLDDPLIYRPPFFRTYKSEKHGHVAVASRDLRKNEVVSEYFGKLVPEEELCYREDVVYYGANYPLAGYRKIHKDFAWDAYQMPDGRQIDIHANPGAWLNSGELSPKGPALCNINSVANCRVVKHPPGDAKDVSPRLCVIMTKDVPRSFELLHCYHSKWWAD